MKHCKACDNFDGSDVQNYCGACTPFSTLWARRDEAMCGIEARFYVKRRGVVVKIWQWLFGGSK
jgi:hypothetical protein